MSRQIAAKSSLSLSDNEVAQRDTGQGKVLFTVYRERECGLLIQNNRLIAAGFLTEAVSRIGAIYIGRIKDVAKNIEAYFVEIADGEVCFLPFKKAEFPFLLNRPYHGKLAEGDTLLVQVERDAQKTKLASVTAHISLSNDYFVLFMGARRVGYSAKLSKEQKEKMKGCVEAIFGEKGILQNGSLAQDWTVLLPKKALDGWQDEGHSLQTLPLPSTGCIFRTKAAEELNGGEPEKLLACFYEIVEQYADLLHRARYRSCFSCLKEPASSAEALLESLAAGWEYQEIVTDSEARYQELKEYCGRKKDPKPLRLYQDEMLSLAKLYSVESKMEMAMGSRVWLKSGGYLVIEPTEALTVIDVNSGKYEASKDSEETALHINMEAAKEIALQLRLRNLSGIIIVDFINMARKDSRSQVLSLLKRRTADDRLQTTVVDMTPLGLVEITRKKKNKPLWEQFSNR